MKNTKSFSLTTICFVIIMLISRIFDNNTIDTLLKSEIHCFVTSCFIGFAVFVVYLLLSKVFRKHAVKIVSVLYGIIIMSELGLSIYTHETGSLMGKELFLRPFSEIMQTVLANTNIFSLIAIVIFVVGGFSLLTYFLDKKIKVNLSILTFSLMLMSIPSSLFIDNIIDKIDINNRNKEMSKFWFMAQSCLKFDTNANDNINFDMTLIDEFLAENPDYIIPDKQYPLERLDKTPDVLGKYFRDINEKPDVVILVVESFGSEMIGENGFAPFLDSLSKKSLYWKKCLSTTIRSYGAVPSITSSAIGPKGFQFGIIPKHNSLFDIFKANGYKTSSFYGGDYSFDCIHEYLLAQDIDYLSDYYQEFSANKNNNLGNWWGYYDHIMFDKSFEQINANDMPMFNLYITITNHEALNINDEEKHKNYNTRAEEIISKMKPEIMPLYEINKKRFCSMLYTDDCIRDFINDYKKCSKYDNTIFIITGDHSSGLIINNKLSYHTVPLIIWSPMLEESCTFNSLVTHNDIAPSINALMREKYHLETPKYVHWASDGLDTSSHMNFSKKMVHVNYSREMREIVYDNYMYWEANKWESELVNKIDENLRMEIIYNDSLKNMLNKKLELYKYIYRYTYHNDKLTKNPITNNEYTVFKELKKRSKIVCTTPDKKPSEVGSMTFSLFDDNIIDVFTDKIKVTLDANIYINDSLWQDEYMDIVFSCKDVESGETTNYIDKVSKFIKSDVIKDDEWYGLSMSKEFVVKNDKDYNISIFLASVRYDDQWVGGSTLTVGDRYAKIEIASVTETP
ncbi:MAG: sulfatase-like hydrolase/transferase [Bacteroidales bacterium]|nr:sulfatase-like hydrolase/transferase [Bacteroidales bacterium]